MKQKGSELFNWLSKPERPGCLAYPLWMLVLVGPLLPIIPIGSVQHDGIKEPSTFYMVSAISLPIILLILLGTTNKQATLSRAYLYSFTLMSVLSVVYLGCKFYAHNHHYGYMGNDLIKALVSIPLYLAAVSLLFFIIENIIERAASKKRERHQRLRPLSGPPDANQANK
jgi:membrane protease YdiL (CAAX protease family)